MTNGHNGNVPILGGQGKKQKAGVGTVGVLIHHLDENGEYEPESVQLMQTPDGRMVPIAAAGRKNLVTAEDLVSMMREMVREELRAALDKK